jgi:hypothetical protein
MLLGSVTMGLGIFSFMWWSSNKIIIRLYDHLFMEIHCMYLGFRYISLIGLNYNTDIENYLILIGIIYPLIRIRYINKASIGLFYLFTNVSAGALIIVSENVGYINLYNIGFIFSILAFLFKTIDILYNFTWGTCLFHLFAALSILFCFEWSLSLEQIIIYPMISS